MNPIRQLARYLLLDSDSVANAIYAAPTSYHSFVIPKKSGHRRFIWHPSKLTKALQYGAIDLWLSELPVHSASLAYRPRTRTPTRVNALSHAPYAFSVRIDFRDFFPSLVMEDITRLLVARLGWGVAEAEKIARLLCVRLRGARYVVPIGAPSSPSISNALMYGLDSDLAKLAGALHGVYTRYADDLVFSSNQKGACGQFYRQMLEVLEACASPRLRVNHAKTRFMSRGTRRMVTGLVVEPGGGISLGRRKKRYVRHLIHQLMHGRLPTEKRRWLAGYLAHASGVEPDFVNRLAKKYRGELVARALRAAD